MTNHFQKFFKISFKQNPVDIHKVRTNHNRKTNTAACPKPQVRPPLPSRAYRYENNS